LRKKIKGWSLKRLWPFFMALPAVFPEQECC
jgi:hypothetical protein